MAESKPRPYAGGTMKGWPAGMDSRQPDYAITVDALRDAVNVDVLVSGKIRRRRGIEQKIADAGAHSLYSDGARLLWATQTALKRTDTAFIPTTVLTDNRVSAPLSYVSVAGTTYFSNESIAGKITTAGLYEPWGIVLPSAAPVATGPGGDRYQQVTCTFLLASGEESGAPRGATALVSDTNRAIVLTSIPQPSDARVTGICIYATELDGEVFYRHTTLPVGTTTYTLNTPYGRGQALRTMFCGPPMPGQLLDTFDSRILVASGSVLWFTLPYAHGLSDYRDGYIPFSDRITMLLAVEEGVYISADRTYFLRGLGTPSMVLEDVLPYKAVERAAIHLPDSKDVLWFSERGFVRGTKGGEAANLTENRVTVEQGTSGCVGIVEFNGDKRYVAVIPDGADSPLIAEDFVAARQAQIDEVR